MCVYRNDLQISVEAFESFEPFDSFNPFRLFEPFEPFAFVPQIFKDGATRALRLRLNHSNSFKIRIIRITLTRRKHTYT